MRRTPATKSAKLPPGISADGRLPRGVEPLGYRLELSVDPGDETFTGRTRIAVGLAAPTRRITLHARGLTIERAAAHTGKRELVAKTSLALSPGEHEEPSVLTLTFAED